MGKAFGKVLSNQQGLHMGSSPPGEIAQPVPPLQERHEPSLGGAGSQGLHDQRQIGHIRCLQLEVGQGIPGHPIEPGGEQHQRGAESLRGGHQVLLQSGQNLLPPASRRQGAVDGEAQARARSPLIGRPAAGIKGRLVHAEEQHGWVAPEEGLGAVAPQSLLMNKRKQC